MKQKHLSYLLGAAVLLYPQFALAYIGPGLASGTVVAVLGTFAGLLMHEVGVIWYPIKRIIRRFQSKN